MDIFNMFFGGGFSGGDDDDDDEGFSGFFGGPRPRRDPRPPPVEHTVPFTLEQLFMGKKKKLKIDRKRPCKSCDGRGGGINASTEQCQTCQGKGVRVCIFKLFEYQLF